MYFCSDVQHNDCFPYLKIRLATARLTLFNIEIPCKKLLKVMHAHTEPVTWHRRHRHGLVTDAILPAPYKFNYLYDEESISISSSCSSSCSNSNRSNSSKDQIFLRDMHSHSCFRSCLCYYQRPQDYPKLIRGRLYAFSLRD